MTARRCLPLLRLVGLVILTVFGPFRWRGRLPKQGGLLLLANHTSDLDPVLVQGATNRQVFFMAKDELFQMPVLGKVIRWFQAFPVKRGEPDRGSIRLAVDLIKSGEVVCVFPEGQLSESGELQPILPGVELIARVAGCPVVCVGIRNANRIMPYGMTIPRPAFRWVTVTIGEPWVNAEDFTARVREELLELSGARPGS